MRMNCLVHPRLKATTGRGMITLADSDVQEGELRADQNSIVVCTYGIGENCNVSPTYPVFAMLRGCG